MELPSDKDDIVVSGIAGRYPKSRNVEEFAANLYGKVDMTCDKEDRFKHVFPKVPPRFGKISNIEKFDAPFFSMLSKHAEWTDPQMRMLLEHSYEAILDAGMSPQSLMGSRTAVLIGVTCSDSKDYFSKNIMPTYDGFRVVG
jgi:fatty acid synthase